jgi:hypothetical protein
LGDLPARNSSGERTIKNFPRDSSSTKERYGEDELAEDIDSKRGFGSEGTNQPLTQIRIL